MTTTEKETFSTLEEIQLRRDQLSTAIEQEEDVIAEKWHELFVSKEDSTKGEYIASIVSSTITAIDAFILVRKLMKNYNWVFKFFKKSKRSKK